MKPRPIHSFFTTLFFLFFTFQTGFAWGPVGHETIAYIAEDHLSPSAQEQIKALLDSGDSLVSISNWADAVRQFGRPETGPWHYIDLPIRKNITAQEVGDYCPKGDCILNQLQKFEGILGDTSKPKEDRLEALKFVVHFMGDLHQPLHCADDSDRGGNEKLVRYQNPGNHGHGAKIKLHALWDGLIEVHTVENPRELALELEKNISNEDKRDWTKDEDAPLDSPPPTPTSQLEASLEVDWALESYRIAKTMIYKDMSPGPQDYSDTPLPLDYYSKMRPIVEERLEKAGIRLAYVLNELLK